MTSKIMLVIISTIVLITNTPNAYNKSPYLLKDIIFPIQTSESSIPDDKFIIVNNSDIEIPYITYLSIYNALFEIEYKTKLKFDVVNLPLIKIFIEDKHDSNNIGAICDGEGNIHLYSSGYIDTIPKNPFIILHEGVHSIRMRNLFMSYSSAYEEGLADFLSKEILIEMNI